MGKNVLKALSVALKVKNGSVLQQGGHPLCKKIPPTPSSHIPIFKQSPTPKMGNIISHG